MNQQPILIEYIKDRVENKNKNFMMVVVGSTGSGKSYATLRLAETLDPTFTIDRCCFKAKEFMKVINELIRENKAKPGTVILWDEVGVEHNAREFMSISNRVINYFFQTCRHLNLIILLTLPLLQSIDSSSRKLMHSVAETTGINTRKKTVSLKVKMLQTNVMTGKEYPKYLRYRKKNKNYVSRKIKVKLPSKQLLDDYEKKKSDFTSALNESILRELEKSELKASAKKPLSPRQEKVASLLVKNNVENTAKELNVNISAVYLHKNNIEKKGYPIKPVWEGNRIKCYEIEGF